MKIRQIIKCLTLSKFDLIIIKYLVLLICNNLPGLSAEIFIKP